MIVGIHEKHKTAAKPGQALFHRARPWGNRHVELVLFASKVRAMDRTTQRDRHRSRLGSPSPDRIPLRVAARGLYGTSQSSTRRGTSGYCSGWRPVSHETKVHRVPLCTGSARCMMRDGKIRVCLPVEGDPVIALLPIEYSIPPPSYSTGGRQLQTHLASYGERQPPRFEEISTRARPAAESRTIRCL